MPGTTTFLYRGFIERLRCIWGIHRKYNYPDIHGSSSLSYAIDRKPITDVKLGFMEHELLRIVLKKVKGTDIEILLRESGLIE